MKIKNILLASTIALSGLFSTTAVVAQEEAKASPFSVGADVYSSYVWRGVKFGGPAFQPSVKFTKGILTVGVWGSYDVNGYAETDPYISLSLPAGFSVGVTDYYYEGAISNFSDTAGSHAIEINLGYTIGGLSLSGNYIVNKTYTFIGPELSDYIGAGSQGGDLYFQATYAFKNFNLFLGAGNGWLTYDPIEDKNEFAITNIGISTSKSIKLTDSFSVPVSGQIIVNPKSEQLFMVVGFSL